MSKELEKLIEGNKRYVEGKLNQRKLEEQRKSTVTGQKPFATIISCSDSRVVPEFIFDAGIGEIFVVRTAGNVCDPIALGSVEYGVEHLHTNLLVVMGHEKCGAVTAAYQEEEAEGNIKAIIKKIRPAINKTKSIEECIECNVKESINCLKEESEIIRKHEKEGKLKIVGMKYSINTGKVKIVE